jgi:rhamnosyltransferase
MSKVCAVIVAYEPTEDLATKVASLARQVDTVYLIDNTPVSGYEKPRIANVVFSSNQNRGGLAGALNIALAAARADKSDFLFVFDQDTEISDDFCSRMLAAEKQHRSAGAGIYGPMHINSSTGWPVRVSVPTGLLRSHWPKGNEGIIEALFLINSCALLDLARIPPTLTYDENMGVDMIDVDFGLAARAMGVKSICLSEISVRHGIGNRKEGSFMFAPTHYGSHRKYLQTRNRLLVWKRHKNVDLVFVVSDLVIWFLDAVRSVALERNRKDKLVSIVRGVMHGIAY